MAELTATEWAALGAQRPVPPPPFERYIEISDSGALILRNDRVSFPADQWLALGQWLIKVCA